MTPEFDGGLFAANPIAGALAQLRDDRYFDPITAHSDIRAISFGTGHPPHGRAPTKDGRHCWGALETAKPMMRTALEAQVGFATFISQKLLEPGTVFRGDGERPPVDMDDAGENARRYRKKFASAINLEDLEDFGSHLRCRGTCGPASRF